MSDFDRDVERIAALLRAARADLNVALSLFNQLVKSVDEGNPDSSVFKSAVDIEESP